MTVYQMYDHFGELVGLVRTTTMNETELQKIWDEYVEKERDSGNDYPTIEDFVEVYRFEKEYDVDELYVLPIYSNIKPKKR